jgi:hypothetical protein
VPGPLLAELHRQLCGGSQSSGPIVNLQGGHTTGAGRRLLSRRGWCRWASWSAVEVGWDWAEAALQEAGAVLWQAAPGLADTILPAVRYE